ncbi:MAG: addiction module protein [Thermodesulfobacteriota bacterium]|jgi:putative addiction module component (TIGR02574 family)
MNTSDIEKMSVHERLEAIEALWNSLDPDLCQEVETPAWHKEVIEERVQKIRDNEAEYFSLEQLAARKYE